MVSLVAQRHASDESMINIDADPRNRDWLKIVRIYRLAGHKIPSWAAIWLEQINIRHNRATFWRSVKKVASEIALEKFKK